MVNLPAGIPGWTVFFTGLLLIAYRAHGVDAPREWVAWTEQQFASSRNIQLLGTILAMIGLLVAYLSPTPPGVLAWLYILSIAFLVLLGLLLVVATNTARHIVIATAEAEDKTIRIVSGVLVVVGLLWALAPWFL